LLIGAADVGQALAAANEIRLISATGSVRMGREVAKTVAARLGRSLLELGGNNAAIIAPSADLELALRAVVFAAVGTCGQRCTSLRRLIVHRSIADTVLAKLCTVYEGLPIGHPLEPGVLVGPLIDEPALDAMQRVLADLRATGAKVYGGEPLADRSAGGAYVRPAIVEVAGTEPVLKQETFAPILYLLRYDDLEQAIELNNDVPQGLASAIFTNDMREAERFCSASGSDCGIVNVNLGTSGAEIGGAFGGEKETGGGRESGSDAWKAYMRRATSTVNYSSELPLAQGIRFDVG
jgi:aldehyde dehydrogenase (NAD+)